MTDTLAPSRKGWPEWLVRHSQSLQALEPDATGLVATMRASHFREDTICKLLGIDDVPLLYPLDRCSYLEKLQSENSALSLDIAFWLLHQPIRQRQLVQLLGQEVVDQLLQWGMVKASDLGEGIVETDNDLYPCLGDYVFTDPHLKTTYQKDHVYQLGTDSYALARFTPRKKGKKALDLCTGSGIHAIQSAHFYEQTFGIDLNPRALQFSRMNAQINGVQDKVKFLQGDLYEPVQGHQFDLITMNPPFVPTPDEDMHIHRTGGESGEIISQRAIEGLPQFLAEGGTFSMILDFPVMRATTYLDRICNWLDGGNRQGGAGTPAEGWGVAITNFGHYTLERYIRFHVDASDVNRFNDMYARYLASYKRQGIYEVGFANVFIRRLPKKHPGFITERVMANPYKPMFEIVEGWLQALTRYSGKNWKIDWAEKPNRSPLVKDIWLNTKGDRGFVEFAETGWSGPLNLDGESIEFLRALNGRSTWSEIADRWAKKRAIPSEDARKQVRAHIANLGAMLLL